MTRLWPIAMLVLLVTACSAGQNRVIVGAGTTLVDSGLIDLVAEAYEEAHPGVEVSVVGEPTSLALELGRQGSADLLLTHAPDLERAFVEEGYALESRPVVSSRFVVLGPADLVPKMRGLTIGEALMTVATEEIGFVSRGDASGTNAVELGVWDTLDIDPSGEEWYLETGQGMGPTILVADQRNAVILAEYGSFVSARTAVSLVDLMIDPEGLDNPYTGHVVKGGPNPTGAGSFLDWMASPDGMEEIVRANEELFGEIVFQPAAS